MFSERDWILRMAKQLAFFIARALKLGQERKHEEAIESLQGACVELFGIEFRVLAMVDARSAVELLGEPARALAFAELLEALGAVEADAARREGHLWHALEIVDQVRARSPQHPEAADLEARLRLALGR